MDGLIRNVNGVFAANANCLIGLLFREERLPLPGPGPSHVPEGDGPPPEQNAAKRLIEDAFQGLPHKPRGSIYPAEKCYRPVDLWGPKLLLLELLNAYFTSMSKAREVSLPKISTTFTRTR